MKNFKLACAFLFFVVAALGLRQMALPAVAQDAANAQPLTRSLNITTGTVLKPAAGTLICFHVQVAGAVGTINDTTTTGAAAAANQIAVIPAVVGVYCTQFPYFNGLVVVPGAAQVVSVSYR